MSDDNGVLYDGDGEYDDMQSLISVSPSELGGDRLRELELERYQSCNTLAEIEIASCCYGFSEGSKEMVMVLTCCKWSTLSFIFLTYPSYSLSLQKSNIASCSHCEFDEYSVCDYLAS